MLRIIDICFSIIFIIILLPLFLPLIVILRFTGEGEIFFFQERVGKNQKLFRLYKFATMLKDSPNLGTGTLTIHNDPRVLPLGKILRKTKINELPQILNILFGHISLIGPRPQSPRNFNAFPSQSKEALTTISPGLTGIGSLVFSNEEEILKKTSNPDLFYDSIIMPYKATLELWYINNRNLKTNLSIFFLTISKVIFPWVAIDLWKIFRDLPCPPIELKDLKPN